ncbi:MAG: bifunctional anthranilate synthase component II/anthranilate phosphoribosyltransferase [Chloroflexota bacterium]
MILMIDNYDSFTYNLVQYLGELGCEITVFRNDQITVAEIERLNPDQIMISPGPGDPNDAGISLEVIQHFHQSTPIFGVCLGHQSIGQAFGGTIIRAENLMHGKTSTIEHDGKGVFADIPSPFTATRYHSLIVDETLPDCLVVNARTPDGEMMGLRHTDFPTMGVQFHPESILTEHGHQLLKNFLDMKRLETRTMVNPIPNSQSTPPAAKPAASAGDANPIQDALVKVMERKHLSDGEAETVMTQIMTGGATPAQIGAYLTALRMKGETVPEITGSARAMRAASIKVSPSKTDLVDTCGTGGDGADTFNISTTATFVVVGAGQSVAKHGNAAMSSRSGSADVLKELGINLEMSPEQLADAVDEVGFGFMFAPRHHPAMKHAIGPRRELKVRTIFNILGPLTNPAGVSAQVIGVYDGDLTHTLAEVLGSLGSKAAMVVHGHGGLDELTTTGPDIVSRLQNGTVTTETLDPQSLGLSIAKPEDLKGGDPKENAAIARQILSGEDKSARRDVVVLNAAAALMVGGKAATWQDGLALAAKSIDSGAALKALEKSAAL